MKYNIGQIVDFNDWQSGTKKSGRIVDAIMLTDTYWIRVKQGFSFMTTFELNGRIAKFINGFSPTIDYYVLEHEVIGLTPEKARD